MSAYETIEEFYRQRFLKALSPTIENSGQFNVFRKDDMVQDKQPVKFIRRNFYKITLIHGRHLFHYADRTLEVSGMTLLFSNPEVPYTFEPLVEHAGGYFCIFNESFLNELLRVNIRELPMFQIGGSPAFILDEFTCDEISSVFEKMIKENASAYSFRFDLIRNYIMEIIYTAMKLQPSDKLYAHINANARLSKVFMEILERQFPIEDPAQQFTMTSAKDFAAQLSVHVNHLNRAVKLTTGKTTSAIIYERIITEAKMLLKHTDWNVAEIGFTLGFEDPTHFNHFFKKQTGKKPLDFRN